MKLNRRNLIKVVLTSPIAIYSAGCSVLNSSKNEVKNNDLSIEKIIKPKRISSYSTIGIIAPSTNVPNPDEINKSIEIINYFNFKYRIGTFNQSDIGYKTRTPQTRANEFNNMIDDDEIDAIFCIRGGYGSAQILDLIDYDLLKKKPKVIIGYSDITAIHTAIFKKIGMITFHGPVLLSSFSNFTINSFKNVFFEDFNRFVFENPKDNDDNIRNRFIIRTIYGGKSIGRLIGGNLSLIVSLIGTEYQPDFDNKILFLEDTDEAPYSLDRMLNQLKMAGMLRNIKGFIWGKCNNCDSTSNSTWDLSQGEVIDYYIKPLGIPSFSGAMIGHTNEQMTLPIGNLVQIDADLGIIKLLESPFG